MSLQVDTLQVADIATRINSMNEQLYNLLSESQTKVKSLSSTWDSPAANATISAYDSFAAKYFQEYKSMLEQYVKFLRSEVDTGYSATEEQNVSLADRLK